MTPKEPARKATSLWSLAVLIVVVLGATEAMNWWQSQRQADELKRVLSQQAVQAAVADPAAAADLAVAQLQVIAEPQHFLHLPHRDPRSRHAVPSPPEGRRFLP